VFQSNKLVLPWGICNSSDESIFYVSAAGANQIWKVDISSSIGEKYAGSGVEAMRNIAPPLSLKAAAFAQPSGLCFVEKTKHVFIADSESSSVRGIDIESSRCFTLVGGDSSNRFNLTAFGDSDGNHFEAKLQHPLAVTWSNHHEILYVADTYNHKVKILNQTDDGMWTCRTLVGSGKKGNRDCAFSEATFNHPSCVVEISRYRLLVCDSFSHSIRDIDLEAKIVSTLELN